MERPKICASQLDAIYHGEATTTDDNNQAGERTPTRVLIEEEVLEEETIKEMVRQLETREET